MNFVETVEATIGEYYEWQGQNSCFARGQYYGEDDWKLTAKADSLKELEKAISDALIQNAIESIGAVSQDGLFRFSGEKVYKVKAIQFITENGIHYEETFSKEDLEELPIGYYSRVVTSAHFKERMADVEKMRAIHDEAKAKKDAAEARKAKEKEFERLKKELGK